MELGFGRYIGKFIISSISAILIIFISNLKIAYAQRLSGCYKDEQGYYLIFHPDNSVEFLLLQSSGLGDTRIAGCGIYKVRKNKLVIRTNSSYTLGSESTFNQMENKHISPNIYEFIIVDEFGYPLNGANITFINANKLIGTFSDAQGYAKLNLTEMPVDSILQIAYIGYQTLRIKIPKIEGGFYKVELKSGNFNYINNKKITLNFLISNDTLYCRYMKDKHSHKMMVRK